MKQLLVKMYAIAVLLSAGIAFASCQPDPKDSDIQENVNKRLSAEADYAGITATVQDGVVFLNGTTSDANIRNRAEQVAHGVTGVKDVVDNVTIGSPAAPTAPVDTATDDALNTGVKDAVKDYPGVNATVSNGEITLTGEIKRDRLPNLMQSLHSLNAKKINNNLTVK